MKPGVMRSGIYKVRHSQLAYPAQALEERMFDQTKNTFKRNLYEPVNRVVYNLQMG